MQTDGQLSRVGDRSRLTFTRSLQPRAREGVARAHRDRGTRAVVPRRPAAREVRRRRDGAVRRERRRAELQGTVVAVDPPRVLEYTWGDDTLRFELQPDGDGTVLTFTDTFDEYGKAARDGAGWHACLDMLGFALDGTTPPGDNGAYWRKIHPGYVERFGPEASTIGPPEGHT